MYHTRTGRITLQYNLAIISGLQQNIITIIQLFINTKQYNVFIRIESFNPLLIVSVYLSKSAVLPRVTDLGLWHTWYAFGDLKTCQIYTD